MHDPVDTLRAKFDAVLRELPFACVERIERSPADSGEIDLIADLKLDGQDVRLLLEFKDSGEPRLARMAAYKLIKMREDFGAHYAIFAAPYISDKSRSLCRELGVGSLDLAGNVFISFDHVFIDRRGFPNPYKHGRRLKSIYSPKSSRALRALLSKPGKRWHVRDLAAEINVSLGHVSHVKQELRDREWIREEDRAFWLSEPRELLEDWATNYTVKKNEMSQYYSHFDRSEIEEKIAATCRQTSARYALALFSGAQRIAPFVISPLSYFFIERDSLAEVAETVQLKEVETGANVVLLGPYDEGVFYYTQAVDGCRICSDIQLYLDLKSYRGRGEEAAETLLKEKIEPEW